MTESMCTLSLVSDAIEIGIGIGVALAGTGGGSSGLVYRRW